MALLLAGTMALSMAACGGGSSSSSSDSSSSDAESTDSTDSSDSSDVTLSVKMCIRDRAGVDWKLVFGKRRIYGIVFLKMIVVPGIITLCLKLAAPLIPMENAKTILLISLLAVIAPTAVTITQMAQLYKRDEMCIRDRSNLVLSNRKEVTVQ